MKEIKLKGLDLSVFFEKLSNGLEVYLLPFKNKSNYSMHYVTKYGAADNHFIPYGKKEYRTVPLGIAHFLEHKMFEQEDGIDPFTFAAKSGTDSNAMTSYNCTQYLFHGNQNFDENLEYLLKYVHSPYFTDENVEKEKGIIAEEIKQYDDEPEWLLDRLVRAAVYQKLLVREDIAGTVETIRKITKEDLYDCYHTFYQPSNMFLVISGAFNVDRAMEIIRSQKDMLESPSNFPIQKEKLEEPVEVTTKKLEQEANVINTKVAYSIKIPFPKDVSRFLFTSYLGMLQSSIFGISSVFREEMRRREMMTSFYCDREYTKEFVMMTFVAESEKPEELVKEIQKTLKNYKVEEADIERISKVWISSEVLMADHVNVSLENIIYDVIEFGELITDKVDIYRGMNKKEMDEILGKIDFENAATVILRPKKKES